MEFCFLNFPKILNTLINKKAFKAYCDSLDSAVVKERFDDLGNYWDDEKTLNNINDLFEKEWVSKIYQKAEELKD